MSNIHNRLTKRGKKFYIFFLSFLKENNCFYQFQRGLFKSYRGVSIEHLATVCNSCSPSIIENSFVWSFTIEGYDFWDNVNQKFKKLTSKNGKNSII